MKRLVYLIGAFLILTGMYGGSVLAQSVGFAPNPALSKDVEALDYEFWISIKESKNPAEFEEYLKVFPKGIYAGLVRARLENGPTPSGPSPELTTKILTLEKEKLTLVRQLAELTALKQTLQQELGIAIEAHTQLESVNQKQQQNSQSLKARSAKLAEDKLSLVRQVAELTALKAVLEQNLAEVSGERDHALATRQQLATEKAELSTQHTALTTEKRSLVRQLVELATLKRALEAQYDTLVGEQTQIEKEKAVLVETSLGQERRLLDFESVRQQLQEQIRRLTGAMAELQKDKTELSEQNATLRTELSMLSDLKIVLQLERDQLKFDFETASSENTLLREASSEGTSGLLSKLTLANGTLEMLRTQLAALGERNASLRAELSALGDLRHALQRQHDQLKSAHEGASSEITYLQSTRSDLQIEIVKLNRTIETLQFEYDELQTEHQEASGKITTLEDTRSELQINIVKLRNEIQSLRDDYAELTQAKAQDESGRQEVEQDNQALIDELSIARQLGRELQIKLALESDDNTELMRNRNELVEKNVNLNADIARLETLKAQLATDQKKREDDIARLFEDKRSLQQQLEVQTILKQTLQQEIVAVAQVREQLAAANQRLTQDKQSLEGQATSLTEDKASLTGQLEAVGEQYRLTKAELETLRAEYADEVAAFKTDRDLLKENLEALEILKARNTELEYEYNRLIRPARSEVGRYVVRVQYRKDESGLRYELKEPGDKQYREVAISQLHEQLKALKQKHGSKLFVKVKFPDDTDISLADAVTFANLIHKLYDYYFSKN